MTNHGLQGLEPVAEREPHQAHRLALLIGILMAFTMMLGPVSCGVPAGEPEAATAEPADAPTDDEDERRGLQRNTAEASPGYVLFNPQPSLTTYLVDLEGQVVHTWQHDHGPGAAPICWRTVTCCVVPVSRTSRYSAVAASPVGCKRSPGKMRWSGTLRLPARIISCITT